MSLPTRIALLLWGIITILAVAKGWCYPEWRSVFPHYFHAGQAWINENNLYHGGRGFLYLPAFASFMSLFANFKLNVASVLWILLQIGVFLLALYRIANFFYPQKSHPYFFLQITLLILPTAFSSIRNFQANILILAIALWSFLAIVHQRWNLTAILLVCGLVVKPVFIVLLLLMTAIFTKLVSRVLIVMLSWFALLVIGKEPYVWQQHIDFVSMFIKTIHIGTHEANWASILNVIPQLTGQHIPQLWQLIIATIFALSVWLTCRHSVDEANHSMSAWQVFIMAMTYMVLFNPRSENNNYIFMGCIFGYGLGMASKQQKTIATMCMICLTLLIACGFELSKFFGMTGLWINPCITSIFGGWLIWQCWQKPLSEIFLFKDLPLRRAL